MDATRQAALLSGQTRAAQKVYGAVPISEEWSVQAILAELARLGTHIQHHEARGCLRCLVDAGLIREPRRDEFIRVKVTEKPMKQKESVGVDDSLSPTDVLIDTAAALRQMADTLDELALKIGESNHKNAEALKAFEAFKQLMKGMT